MARPKWHLSFDCATKTFAFSLSRIDLPSQAGLAAARARARAAAEVARRLLQAPDAETLGGLEAAVAALDAETGGYVRIVDGETADLFPGTPDDAIPTVARIRAVAEYVARRVRPAVAAAGAAPLRVVVEYQMGPNAPARAVACALVALFAAEDVVVVGPSLKNRVALCEAGRLCYFAERYRTTYNANKAHAKYNFAVAEKVFGSSIPPSTPAARGHIADSFMQVLGYLIHGPDEQTITELF